METFKFVTALLLLCFTIKIRGECNVCSLTSGLACVSGTQYQVCILGTPTGTITACPSGTVCSTVGNGICQPRGGDTQQACQDCNKCDATGVFACTSANTFSLCLGSNNPTTQYTGTCQPDLVCNINYPSICQSPAAGVVPTCASASITTVAPTTTTASPPTFNATTLCRTLRRNGRFPAGSNINSSCRQYIYCYLRNGFWYGQLYNCPGRTFFDSVSALCVYYVPARCGTVVQSLSLADIELP